ncbi:hypothetical protein JCM16303_000050 [Sporobolomyces ruberrimus]
MATAPPRSTTIQPLPFSYALTSFTLTNPNSPPSLWTATETSQAILKAESGQDNERLSITVTPTASATQSPSGETVSQVKGLMLNWEPRELNGIIFKTDTPPPKTHSIVTLAMRHRSMKKVEMTFDLRVTSGFSSHLLEKLADRLKFWARRYAIPSSISERRALEIPRPGELPRPRLKTPPGYIEGVTSTMMVYATKKTTTSNATASTIIEPNGELRKEGVEGTGDGEGGTPARVKRKKKILFNGEDEGDYGGESSDDYAEEGEGGAKKKQKPTTITRKKSFGARNGKVEKGKGKENDSMAMHTDGGGEVSDGKKKVPRGYALVTDSEGSEGGGERGGKGKKKKQKRKMVEGIELVDSFDGEWGRKRRSTNRGRVSYAEKGMDDFYESSLDEMDEDSVDTGSTKRKGKRLQDRSPAKPTPRPTQASLPSTSTSKASEPVIPFDGNLVQNRLARDNSDSSALSSPSGSTETSIPPVSLPNQRPHLRIRNEAPAHPGPDYVLRSEFERLERSFQEKLDQISTKLDASLEKPALPNPIPPENPSRVVQNEVTTVDSGTGGGGGPEASNLKILEDRLSDVSNNVDRLLQEFKEMKETMRTSQERPIASGRPEDPGEREARQELHVMEIGDGAARRLSTPTSANTLESRIEGAETRLSDLVTSLRDVNSNVTESFRLFRGYRDTITRVEENVQALLDRNSARPVGLPPLPVPHVPQQPQPAANSTRPPSRTSGRIASAPETELTRRRTATTQSKPRTGSTTLPRSQPSNTGSAAVALSYSPPERTAAPSASPYGTRRKDQVPPHDTATMAPPPPPPIDPVPPIDPIPLIDPVPLSVQEDPAGLEQQRDPELRSMHTRRSAAHEASVLGTDLPASLES